jgi:hypothetical protein
MTTLITYRNQPTGRFCEVALDNGERICITVDHTGVVIERPADDRFSRAELFRGTPDLASDICAALAHGSSVTDGAPMDIMLAMVIQLGSAAKVEEAFWTASQMKRLVTTGSPQ